MAIFLDKGHSQGPQTSEVRLLGGCIYYAEYGIKYFVTNILYINVLCIKTMVTLLSTIIRNKEHKTM